MRLIVGNLDGSDDSISVELLVGGMVGVLAGIGSGLPAGLLVVRGVIVAVVGTGSGCTIGLLVCWVVGAFVAGSVTVVMMVYHHSVFSSKGPVAVFSSKGPVDKRSKNDSIVGPATPWRYSIRDHLGQKKPKSEMPVFSVYQLFLESKKALRFVTFHDRDVPMNDSKINSNLRMSAINKGRLNTRLQHQLLIESLRSPFSSCKDSLITEANDR